MTQRWQWRAHIHAQVIDEQRVILLTEAGGRYLLTGRSFALVAPLLDGSLSGQEIARALRPHVSLEMSYFTLMRLRERGHIVPFAGRRRDSRTAYWHSLDIDDGAARRRIDRARVTVRAVGRSGSDRKALSEALESLGISVTEGTATDLSIVLTDDYLRPEFEEINRHHQEAPSPWMIVKPLGKVLWLGPIFGPPEGPCWACLARRIRENRCEDSFVQKSLAEPLVLSRGSLETTRALGVQMAATQIVRWVASGKNGVLEDKVSTLDTETLETQAHSIQKLVYCPVCGVRPRHGSPEEQAARARLQLVGEPKQGNRDGGYRVRDPEETWQRLRGVISPITGLVPSLRHDSPLDGVKVFVAPQNRPLVESETETDFVRRTAAAGKGVSDRQAMVSCVAEAIERYNGHFSGSEPRIRARFADWQGQAIHPNTLLQFSPAQYASRESWNRRHRDFNWVPEPFDENLEIEWTAAWSLTHREPRWLPTAFCYLGYPFRDAPVFCRGDSNGCASGNTLEEAILQGFFEVVERDATAMWWYNRAHRPPIDLTGFETPYLVSLKTRYREQGRTLEILDLTNDLEIPVVAAVSSDEEGSGIMLGLGAHFDLGLAVTRAVAEVNQMLSVASAKDDSKPAVGTSDEYRFLHWLKNASIEDETYLRADRTKRCVEPTRHPECSELLGDIEHGLDVLRSAGLEMIVLDLSRPELDFATARVVVPGMRHFWTRFAPGRLYSVPVDLGWLEEELNEESLNPVAFSF